jgi:hypothetical protein
MSHYQEPRYERNYYDGHGSSHANALLQLRSINDLRSSLPLPLPLLTSTQPAKSSSMRVLEKQPREWMT